MIKSRKHEETKAELATPAQVALAEKFEALRAEALSAGEIQAATKARHAVDALNCVIVEPVVETREVAAEGESAAS